MVPGFVSGCPLEVGIAALKSKQQLKTDFRDLHSSRGCKFIEALMF